MKKEKETLFWLTLMSFITLIELGSFIIYMGSVETIVFRKEYCLLLVPNLLYIIFQFVVNYVNLTE